MKNIVASCIFIKNKKILLEKRKKSEDNYAGLWTIPGGHKDPKEKIEKTLKREMKEELGIKVEDAELILNFKDKDPTSKQEYVHNVFFCKKYKGRIKGTTEQKKVKWVRIQDIPRLKKKTNTAKKVHAFLKKIEMRF